MSGSTVLLLIVIMIIGGYAGWHVRHAQGANADLKVHKARIPAFRRVRMRSQLISLSLVVLTFLVLRDLIR
ncbi:MAG TPA: hypothetical protein DHU96_15750 [Actinobacteria bacterium]|nr:hypothetical protein [Actinomycetota bacterium]